MLIDLVQTVGQQRFDVGARRLAGIAHPQNLTDVGQGQSRALASTDEIESPEHRFGVVSVAVRGPIRGGQQPDGFVIAQRIGGGVGSVCQFAIPHCTHGSFMIGGLDLPVYWKLHTGCRPKKEANRWYKDATLIWWWWDPVAMAWRQPLQPGGPAKRCW